MTSQPARAMPTPAASDGWDWCRQQLPAVGWAVVSLLPFSVIYLAHFLMLGDSATGFILWDMPYYCANGREIFERGNGLMYCNPYDPSPTAPVIYFHWLAWIVGVGIAVFGFDPGGWFVSIGAAAALATAFLTFKLVAAILPSRRFLVPIFLLSMWGGGLLVATSVVQNISTGQPAFSNPLAVDPFKGWWFLSWGRNLLLPNEAVYHLLVVTAWLAVVQNRLWRAVGSITLLAATHPFSGIQHLAILGAWLTWRTVADRRFLPELAAVLAVTGCFLGYYFGYLPSFPAHRAIHESWSLDWTLPVVSAAAAYGPIGLLAGLRLFHDRRQLPRETVFLAIAAAVSLALAKHEWFLPSRQPLHFTRGYVWMPLFLMAAPLLQHWFEQWRLHVSKVAANISVAAMLVAGSVDNVVWLEQTSIGQHQTEILVGLSPSLREAFKVLDTRDRTGTVLVSNVTAGEQKEGNNYLARTYTRMIPLVGHPHLTPEFTRLQQAVIDWEDAEKRNPSIDRVDVLIVNRITAGAAPWIKPADWRLIHRNADVAVLERRREAAP